MRPAAPVKMTSGMNDLDWALIATRGGSLRARLTAAASTLKYLEPFQIFAKHRRQRQPAVAAGAFFHWGGGEKERVWHAVGGPGGWGRRPHPPPPKAYTGALN